MFQPNPHHFPSISDQLHHLNLKISAGFFLRFPRIFPSLGVSNADFFGGPRSPQIRRQEEVFRLCDATVLEELAKFARAEATEAHGGVLAVAGG